MSIEKWVLDANQRIKKDVRQTPLEFSPYLSELTGANVYLKLENYQITGSFKIRGALNKMLSLSEENLAKGVIAASTGNHAAAVAHASEIAKSSATIYMPETVSEVKVNNLKRYSNIELIIGGADCIASEYDAIKNANDQGLAYISPYNDQEIIGGQGTIGIEILDELPIIDAVFVPVGGGGLISGVGGYLKSKSPSTQVIGCQPVNSAVMYHSIKAGRVLEMESLTTYSDGTAGGMESDSITFPICQENVDNFYLIEENEILEALKILLEKHYMMVEGAAGLSVAALLNNKAQFQNKNVVLILCGNKMSRSLLQSVLNY